MKKIFTLLFAAGVSSQLFAGGILTNTNQSVMFTRLQSRDATIGIDAAYFNPAGLTLLPNNGFFLSLSNQTLGQTRTIKSDYQYLNVKDYEGKIFAPAFPSIYAVYKMDKLAFSAGFNPIAGGGGGTYDTGLPSFEYDISDLVPALASQGAQGYRMDAFFEGTSAWFGYQANISYQINDMISVALGGRFVQAKDTYNGYLKGVELNMGGTWMPASTVMTGIADNFRPGLVATTGIVTASYGGLTFAEAEGGGVITATQRAQLQGGLLAMGLTQAQIDALTIAQAQGYYQGAVSKYDGTALILQDQEADNEATGSGITPILSVNF